MFSCQEGLISCEQEDSCLTWDVLYFLLLHKASVVAQLIKNLSRAMRGDSGLSPWVGKRLPRCARSMGCKVSNSTEQLLLSLLQAELHEASSGNMVDPALEVLETDPF